MEVSLYNEKVGYYGSGKALIGRGGDFYTSVSVGSLFGELLAAQAKEIWERLDRPDIFEIVEQGGHDARLGRDILDAIDRWAPDFAEAVCYTVCDRFPGQSQAADSRIRTCFSLEDIDSEHVGFFLCNELLDAFPIHRICFRESGWKEFWVRFADDDQLAVEERALSAELEIAIQSRLPKEVTYPDGYTTEICLELEAWMKSAAASLKRGILLVIDYGFFADDYYLPERTDGTLRCFSGHRADDDPLASPGERDITAHVDWSAVMHAGRLAGLDSIGFADQGAYMTRLAAPVMKQCEQDPGSTQIDRKWIRQFQTLTHPGMMGRSFGAMAFAKGVDAVDWRGFDPTWV